MSLQRLTTGEATHTIQLYDLEGAPIYVEGAEPGPETALTITLRGRDSKAFRAKELELTNKKIAAGVRSRGKIKVNADDQITLYATCVVDWTNISEEPGDECLPCTLENVISVLRRYPFVFEQVSEAVDDRALFVGK